MQNQQVIIAKITELESELKRIKAQIQKKPLKEKATVWGKINMLENQIDEAKSAIFDFDIENFVSKKDLAKWQ